MTPESTSNVIQLEKEEDTTLALTYERALAITPRLVAATAKAEPTKLGDGYFVAVTDDGVKMTVRLGRAGADTRVRIHTLVSNRPPTKFIASLVGFVIVVSLVPLGVRFNIPSVPFVLLLLGFVLLGVALVSGRAFTKGRAQRLLDRDLRVHAVIRSFEDAVMDEGVAGSYRVAPGVDAPPFASLEDRSEEEARSAARHR